MLPVLVHSAFVAAVVTKKPFLIPGKNLTKHVWLRMQIVSNILYFFTEM
jgi:hypothetical protein